MIHLLPVAVLLAMGAGRSQARCCRAWSRPSRVTADQGQGQLQEDMAGRELLFVAQAALRNLPGALAAAIQLRRLTAQAASALTAIAISYHKRIRCNRTGFWI